MISGRTVEKVNIGGVDISNLFLEELIQIFNETIESGNSKKRVCVTPVNCIVWANKNETLRHIYNSADLTLCDGVPLIWASKFLGKKIKARITGLDLLPIYLEECYRKNYSMFFLGAAEGVAQKLKEFCEEKYPGIKIAGVFTPPYRSSFNEAENETMVAMINKAKPDILWVSLSAPKQDFWIHDNFKRLNTKIAIGVGGAFEVTAGILDRAPIFMQKNGLEWLYRFYKEPKRLFRRYFIEAPAIFPLIIKQRFSQTTGLHKN